MRQRMAQSGREIGEGLEHEAPFRHAWMRDFQIFCVHYHVAEEEDIDVDGPRTF